MPITALIITLNEQARIEACIKSVLPVADEVLVIDSGSTDQTAHLAEALGARVVQQPWLGFGPQKNLGHALAAHPFILSIDADEELSPELARHLLSLKQQGLNPVVAWQVNRLNGFYGRWAHHGLESPDWKVRLYQSAARWSADGVHETLELPAGTQVHSLIGRLLHHSYDTLTDHIARTEKYAQLAAADMLARGKRVGSGKVVLAPLFTFFKSFVLKGGFRSGGFGLILATVSAWSKFSKYARVYLAGRAEGKFNSTK